MYLKLLRVEGKGLTGICGDQPQPFRDVITLILAVRQRKIGKERNVPPVRRPLRRAGVTGPRQGGRLACLLFPYP